MKNAIKVCCVAVSGVIAVKLNEFFVSKQLSPGSALALATALAVGACKVLEYLLLDLPLKCGIARRFIDWRGKFEGAWIFRLNNLADRPYSLVSITYLSTEDTYLMSACGVDPVRGIRSNWHSTDLMFVPKRNQIVYCYECRTVDPNSIVTSGYGVMDFQLNWLGSVTRGMGFFVDTGVNFFKCNYRIERVTRALLRRHLGQKRVLTNDDVEKLIHNYHLGSQTENKAAPESPDQPKHW